MRNAIVKGLCAGALWLLLDAPALWAQSSAIAPLVSTGVSAAMSLGSMANSLAAQQRAAALQQQQFEAQQQQRQLQQDQAAAQRHDCQPGYTGAVIVHGNGTRELICEQRR